MTREELIEDVKVGDLVKIYTEGEESFEGRVADFGASGLKIILSETNTSKRIMYGRITEYDVEEEGAGLATAMPAFQAATPVLAPVALSRSQIFTLSDAEAMPDLEQIRRLWEGRVREDNRNELSRIRNILEYAKKVHEFTLKGDRVVRAIAEYKKLAETDRSFYALIGLIYYELKEYKTAAEYYHMAGAYDIEFLLTKQYNPSADLFETAILAAGCYAGEAVSEAVIAWLCAYSVDHKDYAVLSYTLSNAGANAGKVLLYWYADQKEIRELPDKENLYAEANYAYLKGLPREAGDSAPLQTIIASAAEQRAAAEKKQPEPKEKGPELFRGSIYYYKKENGYGFIKPADGGQIYFHIKQVKDLALQKILMTGGNYKQKITYTKGLNYRGELAADAIALDKPERDGDSFDWASIQEESPQYLGFLEDYVFEEGYGKIQSGGKTYNFVFGEIEDPLLYAEIQAHPYSVVDREVKFAVRDYKSPKTKKTSKIAVSIVGIKTYSEEEIEDFLQQRLVTKAQVDAWLGNEDAGKEASAKDAVLAKSPAFRPVDYVPLEPISSAAKTGASGSNGKGKQTRAVSAGDAREGERKAVEMMLPQNAENPFASLPRDPSGKKYFTDAHRYMIGRKNAQGETVGVDRDKAEELFIKAIQSMDQVSSSVANLVNIYMQKGGDYIVKGLQLLEEYDYLFPPEKLTNLRIQLIDKSGNYEALEQILLSAIPNCAKKSTIWQYMAKLAGIYYKQQKWESAIEWYEKCVKHLDNNRKEFPQYQFMRNGNMRPLIIALYNSGHKEEALEKAKAFLKLMPDDTVIRSIAEGKFSYTANKNVTENVEEIDLLDLQYEDELLADEGRGLSQYLTAKLQEVDLSSAFSKVKDVYSKTQDGVFVGTSADVKKAVDFIQDSILRKNKTGLSAEYRSNIYLGIAKIILDSRNTSSIDKDSSSKLSIDEVKKYAGRYARYTADALLEKYASVDSIRFLYIQALRYLAKWDEGNIAAALNMLTATFFVNSTTLPDELHKMGRISSYKDAYYKSECLSVKDFLIATFLLQERQDYVNLILGKAYGEAGMRRVMIDRLNKMAGEEKTIEEYYDFDALWKKAKGIYYSNVEQLGREISASVNEFHMVESNRQHGQRIHEILSAEMLWNQDEQILESYLKLISMIGDTLEKYTVEEKIEGFKAAEAAISKLKNDIENAPTEFTFNYIYSKLDDLRFLILERFDELYLSSRPECRIYLSNNSVYVKEKTAEIAITFRNAEDRQDADAVEIELIGSEGADFVRCEKKFTSVRNGEELDYLAVFALDDRVIADGQFEVTVNMSYQFRESVESLQTATVSEILPVNITDKQNFVPIENKYNIIIRGTGVDVKTPELFKGRNELIDSICASMSSTEGIMTKNRGIILWGQRRVGKNSVKDYLKEKIRKQYPDAYLIIELGSVGSCRNLREVLITIINKTEDTLMLDYYDIYEQLLDSGMTFDAEALNRTDNFMPEFTRFMDRFSARLKRISPPEKNIPLYFLDEFSYLYEWIEKGEIDGREFMRFWKSFLQDYGICSIIIAQDNIPVWKSRYENEFACMNHDNEITYLDFDGAKELICEPCQREGKDLFIPEAVKLIYDWTRGSAYLIVIFCKHVIDYLNENYTEKATKTIVQIVFEREFIDKKGMFNSADFEPQIQDVANVGHEGEVINELNAKLLKEIASATITASQVKIEDLKFFDTCESREQAERVFNRLKDRKIIEVERDTYCSIHMPLLKWYLLRDQSLLSRDVLNKLTR